MHDTGDFDVIGLNAIKNDAISDGRPTQAWCNIVTSFPGLWEPAKLANAFF